MKNIRDPRYQLRVNNPDAISGIDVLEAIQSQYAASPHMLALLVNKAALADPGKDLMLWYMNIFNPKTAQGVGLDIWGRIVGASRAISLPDGPFLGFSAGFGNFRRRGGSRGAPFWQGAASYVVSELDDEGFRQLIFWKAAANIASAEAPALNELLQRLFPGQTPFVIETGAMKIRVVSRFVMSETQEAIFRGYGLLGKGAGVGVSWLSVSGPVLGFAEGFGNFRREGGSDGAPFWNGAIIDDSPVAWLPAEMPRLGFAGGFGNFRWEGGSDGAPFWAGHIVPGEYYQ